MKRIARFEKVSFDRFKTDLNEIFHDTKLNAEEIYGDIKLPRRATCGSAGYDFFVPTDIILKPMETVVIPTGIRSRIDNGWMLMCCPRSGLGFKYRLRLDNTVGIIDSDYYFADNEGHIKIKLTNETTENKVIELKKGSAFAQGIFIPYGITEDDNITAARTGGFGSTS
ncbi:MAG: dUTP diphosphatase [Huintestinicola sp.]